MINIQPNYSGLKNNKVEKSYERTDFSDNVVMPSEVDIIEKTIDSLNERGIITDKQNVFYSMGKFFENNNYYETARDFFEGNMELLKLNNKNKIEIEDAQFDINRINEKILTPNKLDVQV